MRRGGFLIKSFYLGFFLFPFCFLTLFYVISPGGEIRGFISWDEFGFLLFGQGMKLWRVWNDWITHSFLFFSCFYSYYYFFFFFFFFNLCWRRWNFVICVPIPFYEICPSGNMKKYAKVSHGQWAAFNLVFEIENDRWNKIWFLRVRLWFNILLST